ncbi:MAG: DUF2760 domain-containing protein [Desulfamplus sp.]|nr:DUF2760 domain-containing protein [Desulfamplus sp.]
MDNSKSYSLRSLVVIIIFMALLAILVNACFYFGLKQLAGGISPESDMRFVIPVFNIEIVTQSFSDIAKNLNLLSDNFFVWVAPITVSFFLIAAILLWLIMKISVSSLFSSAASFSETSFQKSSKNISASELSKTSQREDKKNHADYRLEQERQRRLFLHFLSVLQREGRILDFFSEDLTLYDDEQIGAAVRSIQEDCKKTVEKYIAPAPVLNKEEGDVVEIEVGFDPDAIKLIGNVSGNPPFKGVLRHKGWKAGKKDIPKLSDVLDSSIIAPAEVEIE